MTYFLQNDVLIQIVLVAMSQNTFFKLKIFVKVKQIFIKIVVEKQKMLLFSVGLLQIIESVLIIVFLITLW